MNFPLFLLIVVGCARDRDAESQASPSGEVILYCSVDEEFARRILDHYPMRGSDEVRLIPDAEAGKTTGLVQRIVREAESGRPRADVFWSSEIFNTILLAKRGLLEPYESPAAADLPTRYKDTAHRWTASAVRARVLAYDPRDVAETDLPSRWEELSEPRYAKQTAFANPLFGTTRGHVAAMFALWGPERGRAFLSGLRDGGALMVDGNSAAVRALIAGRARFAVTDSDDVWVARRSGASLTLRYLDMGDGGTLLIPCTAAILKGCPHPAAARKLVDYLVSAEVERLLAESDSHHVPVRDSLRNELNMDWPPESKIDYDNVAAVMDDAVAAAREILLR